MRISDWSSDVCSSDLMGSTFKLFTAAMALDAGATTLKGGYDATHPIRIGRFTITDYHAKARWLSVPEIMIYSSTIGSVKMALDVGTARSEARRVGKGWGSPGGCRLWREQSNKK